MKALRFLPLAYVADVHGFVLFAPYLLLVMAAALIARQAARRRTRLVSRLGSNPLDSDPVSQSALEQTLSVVGLLADAG